MPVKVTRRTPRPKRWKTKPSAGAKSRRKRRRKAATVEAVVNQTLRELTEPMSRAFWGDTAAKARRGGRKKRARGYLKAGRDPFESVKPDLELGGLVPGVVTRAWQRGTQPTAPIGGGGAAGYMNVARDYLANANPKTAIGRLRRRAARKQFVRAKAARKKRGKFLP